MRPELLRERLGRAAEARALGIDGDEGRTLHHHAGGKVPAAVLLGLVARAAGPHVLLTQRTAHLKDHAGQISLPGGRIETTDADAVAAFDELVREETAARGYASSTWTSVVRDRYPALAAAVDEHKAEHKAAEEAKNYYTPGRKPGVFHQP